MQKLTFIRAMKNAYCLERYKKERKLKKTLKEHEIQ